MRKLLCLFFLLAGITAGAQTRTYTDNASKTFIFGLENYFYGVSGSLDFQLGGKKHHASVDNGVVTADSKQLSEGEADTVVGIHDFTGDKSPELVVASRTDNAVCAVIYTFADGNWKEIGRMVSPDAKEIRVFRQVVSIRRGDVLCSWTWHNTQFDYKASDGTPEPSLP